MPIPYPVQRFGQYKLGLAFTYQLLHDRFGFDLGARYHHDLDHRIQVTMAIDRAIFETYGKIGLGFERPFPRSSIEPFGHRFMPAMYGCETVYPADADPWGKPRNLSPAEIQALPPWTVERFEHSEPGRQVLSQIAQLKKRYETYRIPEKEFNPHYRALSSVQNLGSVINTAFSIQGEELFLNYLTGPELVHKLYTNITQLMLLCLDYFPRVDGWPLDNIFVGNCTVAMLSPKQYAAFNEPQDRCLMEYARAKGARFMMHQDSNANPHLPNYARLEYLHALDFGQDTDFETVARLFPGAEVNCILFPSWIEAHTLAEVRDELLRLMEVGKRFPAFSFTLLEIDAKLGGDLLLEFHHTFRECALKSTQFDKPG
jgi:hypothetical protein